MSKKHWNIEHLLLGVGQATVPMSRALMGSLAEELEVAISDPSKDRINTLKRLLDDAIRARFSMLSADQRRVLVHEDDEPPASSAFALGQLEFAQLLVSQVAEHRPDDEFIRSLNDRRFINYVRNLASADLTNVELSAALGVEEETVSRNLKKLRLLGLSDYRREGKHVVNFLTPAARNLYGKLAKSADSRSEVSLSMMAALKEKTPVFLQKTLTFSSEIDSVCTIGE